METKPLFKLTTGSLRKQAIASIRDPNQVIVIGKNQHGLTLYAPKYDRRKPRGKQAEIRLRYKGCARNYAILSEEERESLRIEADEWNAKHPNMPPLSSYTIWMKDCLRSP